jgi:hypothetical protein
MTFGNKLFSWFNNQSGKNIVIVNLDDLMKELEKKDLYSYFRLMHDDVFFEDMVDYFLSIGIDDIHFYYSFKSLEPVMQSKSELFSAYLVKPVTRYNKVTVMSKIADDLLNLQQVNNILLVGNFSELPIIFDNIHSSTKIELIQIGTENCSPRLINSVSNVLSEKPLLNTIKRKLTKEHISLIIKLEITKSKGYLPLAHLGLFLKNFELNTSKKTKLSKYIKELAIEGVILTPKHPLALTFKN